MLQNETILLRAVEPEDLEVLYKWENDTSIWDIGNTRQPYSMYMLKQYIDQVDKNIYEAAQLRLMIVDKITETAIGTVDLFDLDMHHSRIALGLYIESSNQGKGYATQTLHLIENYVFNFLQINQLYCQISTSNIASKLMFEKEKYETNGILKNWIKTPNGYEDIIVFQRFRIT
jgi:diamine N-acetyltransferase